MWSAFSVSLPGSRSCTAVIIGREDSLLSPAVEVTETHLINKLGRFKPQSLWQAPGTSPCPHTLPQSCPSRQKMYVVCRPSTSSANTSSSLHSQPLFICPSCLNSLRIGHPSASRSSCAPLPTWHCPGQYAPPVLSQQAKVLLSDKGPKAWIRLPAGGSHQQRGGSLLTIADVTALCDLTTSRWTKIVQCSIAFHVCVVS